MNKHDFYKELMKEHTFDYDKVRRFAKTSHLRSVSLSRQRWWRIPLASTMTVAVAAVSLTVGLYTFFGKDNTDDGSTNVDNPSKQVEIDDGVFQNESEELSFGTKTLYLSFCDSLTFRELQNTLDSVSDTGNIKIEKIYVIGNNNAFTPLSTAEEFDKLKRDDYAQIIGAKVSAPSILIVELNQQREVTRVEVGNDDYAFVPEAILTVNKEVPEAETTVPAVTTDNKESVGTVASSPIERFINLSIPKVAEADFISDYRFVAITPESAALYEIISAEDSDGFDIETITEYRLSGCKKRFSTTGKSILINGMSDTGAVILLADAEVKSLEKINVSDLIGFGELLNAFYDDINRRIVMRVRESGVSAIHVIDRDTLSVTTPDSPEDAIILALNGNALYYARASASPDEPKTTIYKYNIAIGDYTEIASFPQIVSFERNVDLSGFIVNSDNGKTAQFFSAKTEILTTATETTSGLVFYKNSSDILTDGTNLYALSSVSDNSLALFSGEPHPPSRFISGLFEVVDITAQNVRIRLK